MNHVSYERLAEMYLEEATTYVGLSDDVKSDTHKIGYLTSKVGVWTASVLSTSLSLTGDLIV